MNDKQKKLWGALIGLVRASDTLPSIDESFYDYLHEVISVSKSEDEAILDIYYQKTRDKKYEIVPDCFTCPVQCGKNNDYDFAKMDSETQQIQEDKWKIIELLQNKENIKDMTILKAISWLGEDLEHNYYQSLIDEMEQLE